ncbi:MAG: hypothetical protein ACLGHP_08600, partial [Vicinamibacteria bacterium]
MTAPAVPARPPAARRWSGLAGDAGRGRGSASADAAAFTAAGGEHEEPIAGDGTPLVAEFCCAELGTVLGISPVAAKKLIGHALELRHRLPRLWGQVHAGRVPAWRARAVAEATIHSS